MINFQSIRRKRTDIAICPANQSTKAWMRNIVPLGGASSGVVNLVAALAALVGPGEVSDGDDEEAGVR